MVLHKPERGSRNAERNAERTTRTLINEYKEIKEGWKKKKNPAAQSLGFKVNNFIALYCRGFWRKCQVKKRQFKKIEKKKRELLHHILDIVLDINGLEARKQEITGDKPTAFMDISGHVAGIKVRIYPNGWDEYEDNCVYEECYFDDSMAKLSKMLVRLKKETGGDV